MCEAEQSCRRKQKQQSRNCSYQTISKYFTYLFVILKNVNYLFASCDELKYLFTVRKYTNIFQWNKNIKNFIQPLQQKITLKNQFYLQYITGRQECTATLTPNRKLPQLQAVRYVSEQELLHRHRVKHSFELKTRCAILALLCQQKAVSSLVCKI